MAYTGLIGGSVTFVNVSPLSLADTSAHAFSSQAASLGVWVAADVTNTAVVYIGAVGVLTGSGIPLSPGQREFFPVSNSNLIYAITATATQSVHAVVS